MLRELQETFIPSKQKQPTLFLTRKAVRPGRGGAPRYTQSIRWSVLGVPLRCGFLP